jgi:hypothetical protein
VEDQILEVQELGLRTAEIIPQTKSGARSIFLRKLLLINDLRVFCSQNRHPLLRDALADSPEYLEIANDRKAGA